ncbi:Gfo/Idh/MocA family protein [Cellulomonas sp. KRMCY2]|uniref:Gfo/Idh/MocA family protein n=1 Tax=Cellulomonas sp. KRMCY2 TaxID=1304865 RepID=UPI0004B43CB5|nr:Gfo/Idh/MocA family oxidoreductase [Cellulomonas sp. KRMCY2]
MPVRIGVMSAARIVEMALLEPAAVVEGIEVVAVAARDPQRAAEYAAQHGIGRVVASYAELVEDDGVDAVYIATPASLHGPWVRRAVAAGKHVLCEKPFTANAEEAADIAAAVAGSPVVVMEAFHSAHHPLWGEVAHVLASGRIGTVQTASASLRNPNPDRTDIRWQAGLGGGVLMDMGVYPLRLLTYLFGDPTVLTASAGQVDGVDGSMTATLEFAGPVTGMLETSMFEDAVLGAELCVFGSSGEVRVHMPYHPQFGATVTVTDTDGTTTTSADPTSTYRYQLEAFRGAVLTSGPVVSGPAEAVAMMRTVDEIYAAAGMAARMPSEVRP